MTDLKSKLIKIRRKIHKYPELGNQEYKTAHIIESILKSCKIKTNRITKTGVVGILTIQPSNYLTIAPKCIALRADIDALPIQEKSTKNYRSKHKGIMHACGHDANTAIVLGAAMLLSRENLNKGCIKFIFQPNEEGAKGAKEIINRGVLKNPKINAIIGVHVNPELPTGYIGLKSGEMLSAVDKFELEIYGGGGHAAYPHLGKDTVLAASEIVCSLQTIVSRQIDPTEPVVITVCEIHGGEKFNVMPDRVKLTGTVRTLNEELHKKIPTLIENLVKSKVEPIGLKYKFVYEIIGYPLKNNQELVELVKNSAEKVVGKNRVIELEKPSMGGEDFAEYLRYIPGCFIYLGSKISDKKSVPWHHPEFDIDETVLPIGAKVLKEIVLDFFKEVE